MSAKWGDHTPAIMRGNPYAESLDEYADPRNSLEAVATLALAYERRTANLIALERLLQSSGADIEVDAIQERLGLA